MGGFLGWLRRLGVDVPDDSLAEQPDLEQTPLARLPDSYGRSLFRRRVLRQGVSPQVLQYRRVDRPVE